MFLYMYIGSLGRVGTWQKDTDRPLCAVKHQSIMQSLLLPTINVSLHAARKIFIYLLDVKYCLYYIIVCDVV